MNILNVIDDNIRNSEVALDKLLVALTGVFRLLDGKQSTLQTLRGKPEDVQAYTFKLLGQVREIVSDGYNTLKEDIQTVIQGLEKS